jgi:hypothetical protein
MIWQYPCQGRPGDYLLQNGCVLLLDSENRGHPAFLCSIENPGGNQMRFHQLAVGERFEFQGQIYVKTSPLVASHEGSGSQKLIARSATVKPAAEPPIGPSLKRGRNLKQGEVIAAFDVFYERCLRCLEETKPELRAETLESVRKHFGQARQAFLDSVARPD